jgi:NADPH2:quinone reductase
MNQAATYRAMICPRLDGPDCLVPADLPRRALEPGEVRLEVRAAGVNFPDLLVTRGLYQHKPELPFAPGLEVSGRILEVGADVTNLEIGQEVMAGTKFSGFATELVVAATTVHALPRGFAAAEGASFLVAARTAYHALVEKADLAPGETLVVLGAAGGVGLAAVEMGKLAGARVVAVASRDEGLATAAARGADETINHSHQDLRQRLLELTDGNGADVVVDPVGGELFAAVSRTMAWDGRLVVVGFASGTIPTLKINLPLVKGYSLIGIRAGESARRHPRRAADGMRRLLAWCEEGRLRPHISHRFPLQRAAEALHCLESRQAVGRIVLEMETAS